VTRYPATPLPCCVFLPPYRILCKFNMQPIVTLPLTGEASMLGVLS